MILWVKWTATNFQWNVLPKETEKTIKKTRFGLTPIAKVLHDVFFCVVGLFRHFFHFREATILQRLYIYDTIASEKRSQLHNNFCSEMSTKHVEIDNRNYSKVFRYHTTPVKWITISILLYFSPRNKHVCRRLLSTFVLVHLFLGILSEKQ